MGQSIDQFVDSISGDAAYSIGAIYGVPQAEAKAAEAKSNENIALINATSTESIVKTALWGMAGLFVAGAIGFVFIGRR